MFRVIPRADKSTIERVLDRLPEPSSVTVRIFGGTELIEFKKLRADIDIIFNGHLKTPIKDPTKEKIRELLGDDQQMVRQSLPRMDFEEAVFNLKGAKNEGDLSLPEIRVTLTMYKLEITYYSWLDTMLIFDLLKDLDMSQLEVVITKKQEDQQY